MLNKEFGLKEPTDKDDFEGFITHGPFQCPLCPGHIDDADDVAWSMLLDELICRGCTYDIHYGFVGWDDQPGLDQYNHADTIERIISITGRTYQQLKCQHMKYKIQEWGGTVPEVCLGVLSPDQPDAWLRVLNKQLDNEFRKLVEQKRKGRK